MSNMIICVVNVKYMYYSGANVKRNSINQGYYSNFTIVALQSSTKFFPGIDYFFLGIFWGKWENSYEEERVKKSLLVRFGLFRNFIFVLRVEFDLYEFWFLGLRNWSVSGSGLEVMSNLRAICRPHTVFSSIVCCSRHQSRSLFRVSIKNVAFRNRVSNSSWFRSKEDSNLWFRLNQRKTLVRASNWSEEKSPYDTLGKLLLLIGEFSVSYSFFFYSCRSRFSLKCSIPIWKIVFPLMCLLKIVAMSGSVVLTTVCDLCQKNWTSPLSCVSCFWLFFFFVVWFWVTELDRDAEEEQIKVAYRRLAKFYHPDGTFLDL